MKNTPNEVLKKIEKLQSDRNFELDSIRAKMEEASEQLTKCDEDIKNAVEHTNLEAYEEGLNTKKRLMTALEMYQSRYEQINQKKFISETESDIVIDGLIDYEEKLATAFREKLSSHMADLIKMYDEYSSSVRECEAVLNRWTSEIHSNYRSATTQITLEDGTVTNRLNKPCKVHQVDYTGCNEANLLRDFIYGYNNGRRF